MSTAGKRSRYQAAVCLGLPAALAFAVACHTSRDRLPRRGGVGTAPPPNTPLLHLDEPLVDVAAAIPGIAIELPYATDRNAAGIQLYPSDMPALLDRDTCRRLRVAQATLARDRLGLKIWDAYRPPEVQQELWRRSGRSGYVADPRLWWSKHCSGRAVDVTLVDLDSGRQLPMPSHFDDFSKRAASDYRGRNPEIRRNLGLLQEAMLGAGFIKIDMEWWHFANAEHYHRNIAPVPAAKAGIDLPRFNPTR